MSAADTASGPTRTRLPADVWVLVAAAAAVAVGYGLVAPVLPQYARDFDVSAAAASVVVSAFAFFRLVFAPVGGALVTRLGERWVYMTGLLVVAASTLATGCAQSYWQLLLFRGLGGLGSTMFTISAMALLVQLAPPGARGRVSGLYATAFLLGNITGPAIGGRLGEYGMRVPFFVYAGTLLVATALVALFLRGGRKRVPSPDEEPQETLSVRDAISDTGYRASLVSAFANGFGSFGVRVGIIPLFAASTFSAGPAVAGTALASFAVGTGAVVTFSGRLSDRLGRKPLVLTGLVVAGVATLGMGHVTTVPLLVAASAVGGVGAGLLNPSQQATVADVIGPDRGGGKAMAAFQMATDSGTICGPIVIGAIVDKVGFTVGFTVTGVVLLAAVVPWLFARETLPARADAAAGV